MALSTVLTASQPTLLVGAADLDRPDHYTDQHAKLPRDERTIDFVLIDRSQEKSQRLGQALDVGILARL